MGGPRNNPEKSQFCLPPLLPDLDGPDPRFFMPEIGTEGQGGRRVGTTAGSHLHERIITLFSPYPLVHRKVEAVQLEGGGPARRGQMD